MTHSPNQDELPEEIARAIEALHHWAFMQGAVQPGTTSGNRAEELAYAKRSTLTAAILSSLTAAEAGREEAEAHLAIARGPAPQQVFDEIGMAGRKTTLGKHQAVNDAHLRKVMADLDAAGMTEAADTLLWAHWWRQNERARAERLERRVNAALDDACRMSAILLMAGEMTAQERRTAQAVADGLATKVRAALTEAAHPAVQNETNEGAEG